MLIDNTTPIVVAASEQMVFRNLWVSKIVMDTPFSRNGNVLIELNPFNSETNQILNKTETIYINNLTEKSQTIPEISAAIEAILVAVNAIKNPKDTVA
jgi:hypothetical protein